MATYTKPTAVYSGYNSYGVSIEVATDDKGNAFFREYIFNGYNKAWTKWQFYMLVADLVFPTHVTNRYTYEEVPIEVGSLLDWGFTRLSKLNGLPKYRLPIL
jgi:hypothetical protein